MDPKDLSDADTAILELLTKGRATKGYLVDETGYHRNTVGHRLEVLEAAGYINCIHESTALYELIQDPRESR
jgi:DNA-binding IclR family transcriptional regulator